MSSAEQLTPFQRGILRRLTIALVMLSLIWLAEFGRRSTNDEFEDFDAKVHRVINYANAHYADDEVRRVVFLTHFENQLNIGVRGSGSLLIPLARREKDAKR